MTASKTRIQTPALADNQRRLTAQTRFTLRYTDGSGEETARRQGDYREVAAAAGDDSHVEICVEGLRVLRPNPLDLVLAIVERGFCIVTVQV